GGGEGAGDGERGDGWVERMHDGDSIIAKERAGERRVIRPSPTSSGGEQGRKLHGGLLAQGDEICRLTPRGRFLGTARGDHLADNGRQHICRVLPADEVEALE